MRKYRIKIIEWNNGTVEYIPQTSVEENTWVNLVFQINPLGQQIQEVVEHTTIKHLCATEEEALVMINRQKEQDRITHGFEIKSEAFKEVL